MSKLYMVFRAGGQEQAATPVQVNPSQPWESGGTPRYNTRGEVYMTYKLVTAVRASTPEEAVQVVASLTQTLGTYVAVEGFPVSIDLTASPVRALEEENGKDKDKVAAMAAQARRIRELEEELGIEGTAEDA